MTRPTLTKIALLAVLTQLLCCTPIRAPRSSFIAEGEHRICATTSITTAKSEAEAWYESYARTVVPRMRQARGNAAVYVVRRDDGVRATLTIITIWRSPADFERCVASGACPPASTTAEILFEASS
jgi:hypothetical protein